MPQPATGEILVRVHASLVSPGTELGPYEGKPRSGAPRASMRPFGYQNAGTIVAMGEACGDYRLGQRVACIGAGYALHAEYACVPYLLTAPLPDAVSDEEGAFAMLVPTAMQAVRRAEVAFGQEIAVMGLGLVGSLSAQVCRIAGARVFAFDRHPLRAERARACGVDLAQAVTGDAAVEAVMAATEGRGIDGAILALTHDATEALEATVRMMHEAPDGHKSGPIALVGGARFQAGGGATLGNLDLRSAARTGPGYHDLAYEHGHDYPRVFVRWTTQDHLRLFVRWLAEGALRVRPLVTDDVPLEEAPAACAALMDDPGNHLGVVIRYR